MRAGNGPKNRVLPCLLLRDPGSLVEHDTRQGDMTNRLGRTRASNETHWDAMRIGSLSVATRRTNMAANRARRRKRIETPSPAPQFTTLANEWMTITEAAEYLRLHHRTIRAMIARGDLPAYRVGLQAVRLHRDDVAAQIKRAV
jgi:excisionase family DNA binding protein